METMKLRIIAKLWSSIYDLLFLMKGTPTKSLDQIHDDLDAIEVMCRPYSDVDDSKRRIETFEGGENDG